MKESVFVLDSVNNSTVMEKRLRTFKAILVIHNKKDMSYSTVKTTKTRFKF